MLKSLAAGCLVFGAVALSAPAYGQYAARDALSMFPGDTQQIAYTSLSDLRSLPQYPLIHEHLLSPQLRNLETFLQSAGLDPEKEVDELVLGWRGPVADQSRFFGIAEGHFEPNKIQDFYTKSKMPVTVYDGYDLYAFGSGAPSTQEVFTFFDYSTAAFGRLTDLKALVDVKNGKKSALSSNSDFRDWEGQLEGVAPQWGIATGQAAANMAIPWITGGNGAQIDPRAFFAAVKAVLYRVTWDNGIATHLSVICQNTEAAGGIGQLMTMLKNAKPSAQQNSSISPAISQVLQNMQVQVDGTTVNLSASTSITDLAALLAAPAEKKSAK